MAGICAGPSWGGTILVNSVWNSPNGDWALVNNWTSNNNPNLVPDNFYSVPQDILFTVNINSGVANISTFANGTIIVDTLHNAATLNVGTAGLQVGNFGFPTGTGLTNSAGATINILANSQLTVPLSLQPGFQILNNGNINVAGTFQLSPALNTSLGGNGTITMQGGSLTWAHGQNGILALGNNTLQGYGSVPIGFNTISIQNSNLVNANNGAGKTLEVYTGWAGANNTGTMQASGGGTLLLDDTGGGGSGLDNKNGIVQALNNSTVVINGKINGGTLASFGTGRLLIGTADANGVIGSGLGAVLNGSQANNPINITGSMQVTPGSLVTVNGVIQTAGSGSFQLGSASGGAQMNIVATQAYSGSVYPDPYNGNALDLLPGQVTLSHTSTGAGDNGQNNKFVMAPNTGNLIAGIRISNTVQNGGDLPPVLNIAAHTWLEGAGTIKDVILWNQGTISVSQGVPLTLDYSHAGLVGFPGLINDGKINIADNNTLIIKSGAGVSGFVPTNCGGVGNSTLCLDSRGGLIELNNHSTLQVAGGSDAFVVIEGGLSGNNLASAVHTFAGTTGAETLQTPGFAIGTWVVDNLNLRSGGQVFLPGSSSLTVNSNASIDFISASSLTLNPNSSALINGNLVNYNAATGTLSGSNFELLGATVAGQTGGTLRFAGADIHQLNSYFYISGNAQVTDLAGNSAFRNLAGNGLSLQFDNHSETSNAPSYTTNGPMILDHGSSLTLNNATSFLIQNTDPNYAAYLTLNNGSTVNLPNAVSFTVDGSTPGISPTALTLDNASLTLAKTGITLINANLNVLDNSTLIMAGSLALLGGTATVGTGNPSDTSSITAHGANLNGTFSLSGPQNNADFTGGKFQSIDTNGTLLYGQLNIGGAMTYDTHNGDSAGSINTIAFGAGVSLSDSAAQLLSSTNGVTSNALSHLANVNGTLVVGAGANASTDQFLTIGANGGVGVSGTFTATGLDDHGVLAVYAGGQGTFVGIDTPNVVNGVLKYGTFYIAGRLDYSGTPIGIIGAGASLTLQGAGAIFHHSVPGPALGSLSEVDGTLNLQGGAGLSTDQVLVNKGAIGIGLGSTLTAAGFVQDDPGAEFFGQGLLELNGGTFTVLQGLFYDTGTIDGNIYLDVQGQIGAITGNLTVGTNGAITLNPSITGKIINNGKVTSDATEHDLAGFSQSDTGTLHLFVEGPDQGLDYDWMNVSGPVHFSGKLDVSWGPGGEIGYFCSDIDCNDIFSLDLGTLGSEYNLISWLPSNWDGSEFSSIDLPTLGAGLHWGEIWGPTGFSIEVENGSAAPEPGPSILLGIGLVVLMVKRFRR